MQILEKCRPEGDDERLFRVFLSSFIAPMFARCSSRIEDLQVLLQLRPLQSIPCRAHALPGVMSVGGAQGLSAPRLTPEALPGIC